MSLTALAITALPAQAQSDGEDFDVRKQMEYCNTQVLRALDALADSSHSMQPRNILKGNKQKGWNCRKASAAEWCSGFWPGILWMDYSLTAEAEGKTDGEASDATNGASENQQTERLRKAAEGYTEALDFLTKESVYDHDLGFLVFCSYGKAYEATGDARYKRTILDAADSLATLFNPKVGTILSWPREVDRQGWPHNTIMDNMMNLDMMLWAAENGGNPLLRDLAVMHATTTMKHHFRPDGSCYHVAVYDTVGGDFIKGVTHQGYADHSMWTRGQSWAIYGYTMVYRYTRDKVFLDFVQKVTDVYLRRLMSGGAPSAEAEPLDTGMGSGELAKKDLIPAWDFDDPRVAEERNGTAKPGEGAPKDASAACVIADALLELSGYVQPAKGDYYRRMAVETLRQLSTDKYQSGDRNVAFLMHSTGHHPAGSEIDASIIYADYYYIEALSRLMKTMDGKK